MTTGDKIKLLRKQRDWTQDELAEKLGYTDRSSIAKIESGGVDLPESRIKQICEIFNVTPAYFFDVEEKEPDNVIYPNFNRVPLFGDIACGDPITAVEIFDGDVGSVKPRAPAQLRQFVFPSWNPHEADTGMGRMEERCHTEADLHPPCRNHRIEEPGSLLRLF